MCIRDSYWTNHNDITVTAWWPYTACETTPPAVKVKANQSAQKDFDGSDLIVCLLYTSGGGITAGYQLRLNKALDLDFNLGLGSLNAAFEKYEVIDGVRVRCGNETKNWCGPINAGVTLVWKLF